MTNIYFLIYPQLSAFKVGKADNVFSRASNIKTWWGEPDYQNSLSLSISKSLVFKIEKALHLLLTESSMSYSEGDGKTEFFSIEAHDDAIEYVNVFTRLNSLTNQLVKGITIPDIDIKTNTNTKRIDRLSTAHHNGTKRLTESLDETFSNLRTTLRINGILIDNRHKIHFEVTNDKSSYKLVIYNKKILAKILFKSLRVIHRFFSGGFIAYNIASGLTRSKDYFELRFNLEEYKDDPIYSFVIKEINSSLNLLKKASIESTAIASAKKHAEK